MANFMRVCGRTSGGRLRRVPDAGSCLLFEVTEVRPCSRYEKCTPSRCSCIS